MSRIAHFLRRLTSRSGESNAAANNPSPRRTDHTTHQATAPHGTWLVIGLGNPGPDYATTRHNVGYFVIDELLDRYQTTLEPIRRHPASAATITVKANTKTLQTLQTQQTQQTQQTLPTSQPGPETVILARSTTYMNNSGEAVKALASSAGITPDHIDHIVVIHDELDIAAGSVRLKKGGGENGHNGLKSITDHLGTRDYTRIRMGIGRPPQGTGVVDYVLAPFNDSDRDWLNRSIATAADAVEILVQNGINTAQHQIHSR